MIPNVLDPSSPEKTVENAMHLAGGVARIAGYAVGMNGTDLDALTQRGIPSWAMALGAAVAGAILFARYAPEHWVGTVRHYRIGG